ncbi:MAG: phenylalanine--tRNA ligase subunit beta [Deltaproteobacteria bacterium]|nr:phenylalanine--tRNA ligase subunit beta [Deltaproteobacteria bacterium]
MKVSLSWLKAFVSVDMTLEELTHDLTMVGLEVEGVADRYAYLDNVFVGRITAVKDHPNADRLKVCDVALKNETRRVVCGAPNVVDGMLAPLALPGTQLPDGTVLKQGIIRGEASEGMLCSETELALGEDASGLMVLNEDLPVGENLAVALNLSDPVLEIDLTPNRPDCLSIIGTAREVAAIQGRKISVEPVTLADAGHEIDRHTSVTVEAPDDCPRYTARLLENIIVGPSPQWLQNRLISVGLRPINNIVDITNFVLMEYGQPLHAFDFDRLAENRIVVRKAEAGEKFTTLDGKERELSAGMLLICDGEKPVGLAGIMGGLNSEIESTTTRVLIESAYFNPTSIRKTAKTLGLNTDASHRFERGIDPETTPVALDRAAKLMMELAGATLVDGAIDAKAVIPQPAPIVLTLAETNRLLGTDLDREAIKRQLKSIEFKVENGPGKDLTVTAPTFRVDITRTVDLIEEVARLTGYNNIPATHPLVPAETRRPSKALTERDRIKRIMTGFGFSEAINYSFMDSRMCDSLNLTREDSRRNFVEILNPLTEDQTVMRTSIIPGMIRSMHRNISRQIKRIKLFEVGKIFIRKATAALPDETEMLGAILSGPVSPPHWNATEKPFDFYDMKGIVEGLLNALNVDNIAYTAMPDDRCRYTRPGHTARILHEDADVGLVGELQPDVMQVFDLKQNAYIFELDLTRLYEAIPAFIQARDIPRFPAISRDATIIIDRDIEAGNILECVREMDETLVENVLVFDVFTGDPIAEGKKSISFRITYRSHAETLEDERVNRLHKEITFKVIQKFDAGLPE